MNADPDILVEKGEWATASKESVEFRKPWGICRRNPFGADCICRFWRNISREDILSGFSCRRRV